MIAESHNASSPLLARQRSSVATVSPQVDGLPFSRAVRQLSRPPGLLFVASSRSSRQSRPWSRLSLMLSLMIHRHRLVCGPDRIWTDYRKSDRRNLRRSS